MQQRHCASGYILILTFMVISLATVLVTYIFNSGSIHIPFIKAMIDREKAKNLALSGIQIAISQLSDEIELESNKDAQKPAQQQQKDQNKSSPEQEANKIFFQTIVPTINRWQQFSLKEEIDGMDGIIKICLMSEEGKVNINALFDFKKHTFKGDVAEQKINNELLHEIFKCVGKDELYAEFEKFLKDRKYRLDDITELMKIKGFQAFKNNIFYEPPAVESKNKQDQQLIEKSNVGQKCKGKVYLTDIFTIWSGKSKLDPWLISDSLCGLLGMKRAESNDINNRKQVVKEMAKDFKEMVQFPADWKKIFEPLYGIDFKDLPKGIEKLFNIKFEPKIFSVLSYGTVGDITQKMLAILERVKKTEDKRIVHEVTIKKIYWL